MVVSPVEKMQNKNLALFVCLFVLDFFTDPAFVFFCF